MENTTEVKKKWYGDRNALFTFLGIVISLLLGVYNVIDGIQKESKQDEGQTLDSIDKSIKELITIDRASRNSDPNMQTQLHIRKSIIIASLLRKMDKVEDQLSPEVHVFLGRELMAVGEYENALKYLNLALNNKDSDIRTKSITYGLLAHLNGLTNRPQDKETYWLKQISALESLEGKDKYIEFASAYESAAHSEYGFNESAQAETYLDSAIANLSKADIPDYTEHKLRLIERKHHERFQRHNYHIPISAKHIRQYFEKYVSTDLSIPLGDLDPQSISNSTLLMLEHVGIDSLYQLDATRPNNLLEVLDQNNIGITDELDMVTLLLYINDPQKVLQYYTWTVDSVPIEYITIREAVTNE